MDEHVNQTEQNKSTNFFVKVSKTHFQKLSNPYHLAVFMELAQFQKDAFPSQATIAKNRGMSLRQVKYSLAYLLAENLIEKGRSERGMTVHYRIAEVSTTQAQSAQVPGHTVPTPQAYSAYPPRHTVPTINKSIKKKNYVCDAREAQSPEQPTHTNSKDLKQPSNSHRRQLTFALCEEFKRVMVDHRGERVSILPNVHVEPLVDEAPYWTSLLRKAQSKGRTFQTSDLSVICGKLQQEYDSEKRPNLTVVQTLLTDLQHHAKEKEKERHRAKFKEFKERGTEVRFSSAQDYQDFLEANNISLINGKFVENPKEDSKDDVRKSISQV